MKGILISLRPQRIFAQGEGVDVKKVIIVFWTETNSIMKDKFEALKEEENW